MKKIFNRLFSKLVLIGITILIQFAWIVYTIYITTDGNPIANTVLRIISVVCALYVVYKDMKLYNKLSWVFLILFMPIIGCPCYFLFGRSDMTKKVRTKMSDIEKMVAPLRIEDEVVKEALFLEDEVAWKQSNYISNTAKYPVYREADSRYYKLGQEVFDDMLKDLKEAKEFIFLEFFIMDPGIMYDSIIDILEQKAKEGVHVRMIYDDFGCIRNFPSKFYKELQAKGIHCACFNPFRPSLDVVMNNRDHRKILVIDGKIAYTGGINLADEYINEIERFGYWKDAGVRITGEAVWSFTTMFLEMWSFITKSSENFTRYKVTEHTDLPSKGFVQPFADSPLDKKYVGEAVYLNLINNARRYVYIFTPYLILSTELITALVNAAGAGVDVRIVTPGIPDKKIVYLLTQANYETLIRGGVKIFQYTPGFIHSKCFVADDEYACVGTINLDFRSLYLHFECGAFMYKTACIPDLKADALATFEESREILLEDCENKNFFFQLFLSVMHLFAPLL
uniref:cardiolipin synthase n=1 Tax=Agathobacter sp. TaxID=2021311 RepID=UPI0040566886